MKVTDFLICPICYSKLNIVGNSLVCLKEDTSKHHCFDISSSGYVDLSYRCGGGGDPKDAVNDRTSFLEKGYYIPLAEKINDLCGNYYQKDFLLVDAGCGEGFYSENIASKFPDSFVFGVDLSKHAVRKASSRRKQRGVVNSFYSVSSIFRMPIVDLSANCVLSMFAPIAENEIYRILKQDGILIIGAAGVNHLYQLKNAIYDSVVLNTERADLPKNLQLLEKHNLSYTINIDNSEDIIRLFGMTPYRFRTSEESFNRLKQLSSLSVDIDVDFYVYKK